MKIFIIEYDRVSFMFMNKALSFCLFEFIPVLLKQIFSCLNMDVMHMAGAWGGAESHALCPGEGAGLGPGDGPCTVWFNASWVMVTWDPLP